MHAPSQCQRPYWHNMGGIGMPDGIMPRVRAPRGQPPRPPHSSQNGRSSNVPILAVGWRDATSIASSRSAHSSTLKPAICSLVSANGPSLTRTSPPRTRTVLASLTGRRRPPASFTPRASISLSQASTARAAAEPGTSESSSGLSSAVSSRQWNSRYFMGRLLLGMASRRHDERDRRGRTARLLAGAHPVVAGVVLDLGQAQHLEDRRHVVAEPAAKPLLRAVPAAHRVAGRPAPGLDRALGGLLLLVGVAQRHPVAALLQHRVQILDAAKLVAQLGGADLDDQRRGIGSLVAPGLEVGLPGRRGQDPRIAGGTGAGGGAAAHRGVPPIRTRTLAIMAAHT